MDDRTDNESRQGGSHIRNKKQEGEGKASEGQRLFLKIVKSYGTMA